MHGIEAGLRLKWGISALEFNYQGAYQTLKATGQNMDVSYTDRVRTAVHSAAAGIQLADRIWGMGTELQFQFYKVKFIPEQNGETFKNVQDMLALKFYLMAVLQGGKGADMAIQPYYVLPFQKYDAGPFAQYLGMEPSGISDRWNRFGLTVLFYNGEK